MRFSSTSIYSLTYVMLSWMLCTSACSLENPENKQQKMIVKGVLMAAPPSSMTLNLVELRNVENARSFSGATILKIEKKVIHVLATRSSLTRLVLPLSRQAVTTSPANPSALTSEKITSLLKGVNTSTWEIDAYAHDVVSSDDPITPYVPVQVNDVIFRQENQDVLNTSDLAIVKLQVRGNFTTDQTKCESSDTDLLLESASPEVLEQLEASQRRIHGLIAGTYLRELLKRPRGSDPIEYETIQRRLSFAAPSFFMTKEEVEADLRTFPVQSPNPEDSSVEEDDDSTGLFWPTNLDELMATHLVTPGVASKLKDEVGSTITTQPTDFGHGVYSVAADGTKTLVGITTDKPYQVCEQASNALSEVWQKVCRFVTGSDPQKTVFNIHRAFDAKDISWINEQLQ